MISKAQYRMKSNRDFIIFKREFTKWQRRFGLNGYKVYFKHEPIEDCFADITKGGSDMVATVRYNSAIPESDRAFSDPRTNAKHEAIHLLISRLETLGRDRYSRSNEIYEATEELVRRLEVLIQ